MIETNVISKSSKAPDCHTGEWPICNHLHSLVLDQAVQVMLYQLDIVIFAVRRGQHSLLTCCKFLADSKSIYAVAPSMSQEWYTFIAILLANRDAGTLWVVKPKAVIAEDLLSDMTGLDVNSALQASIATYQKQMSQNARKHSDVLALVLCTSDLH